MTSVAGAPSAADASAAAVVPGLHRDAPERGDEVRPRVEEGMDHPFGGGQPDGAGQVLAGGPVGALAGLHGGAGQFPAQPGHRVGLGRPPVEELAGRGPVTGGQRAGDPRRAGPPARRRLVDDLGDGLAEREEGPRLG